MVQIKFSHVFAQLLIVTGIVLFCLSCDEDKTEPSSSSLTVTIYTSGTEGNAVNSVLLEGVNEVVLIDSQMLKAEAENVVNLIQQTDKKLTRIYITHSHPDHYFGLAVLQDNFPDVQIIALPKIVAAIQSSAASTYAALKPIYGDKIADRYIIPTVFDGTTLQIESNSLPIYSFTTGESGEATTIHIPHLNIFIATDTVYNNTHLFLAEKQPDGWNAILNQIEVIPNASIIYPGHGAVGGKELLNENRQYIADFIVATQEGGATADTVIAKMKALYPLYGGDFLLQYSASAYFPKEKK